MGQSAEELRQEIEASRGHLTSTVDAIGDRVSPGRVVERRVNRVKGGVQSVKERVMGTASDAAGTVGDTVSGAASSISGATSGVAGGAGGTGLGLFIAQGLVGAMGGRIWIASGAGGGASLTFELPVAETPPPAES